MKKLSLLFLVPLVLTSCNSVEGQSIKVLTNYETGKNENYVSQPVSANQIVNMIDSNMTFPLFIYSKTCGHCETFKTVFKKYNETYHTFYYQYESNSMANDTLKNAYPDIFNDHLITPSLLLISKKELSYSFSQNRMGSFNSFKPVAKQHFEYTKVSTLINLDTYEKYCEENSKFYCFVYNSEVSSDNFAYGNIVFDNIIEQEFPSLIINQHASDFICDLYQLDYENNYSLVIENGQIKNAITNLSDSESLLNQLNQYFLE